MKIIKTMGMACLVACAGVMIMSTSAAAATVGGFECKEGSTVTNLGSNCLESSGGKFEETEIVGETVTGKLVSSRAVVTQASGTAIACTGATSEGVVTSRTEGRATVKYTGCTSTGGNNCSSTGASAKEVVIPVSVKIVSYEAEGKLKAGLLSAPRNASGANLQSNIKCGALAIEARGSLIGAINPESEMSLSFTVKFVVNGDKNQIPDTVKPYELKIGESAAFEAATYQGEGSANYPTKVEVMG